jgi:hypothetical protein
MHIYVPYIIITATLIWLIKCAGLQSGSAYYAGAFTIRFRYR